MVGRPRRRHAVDTDGRLHQPAQSSSLSAMASHKVQKKPSSFLSMRMLKGGLLAVLAIVLLVGGWIVVRSYAAYNQAVDKSTAKKAPALSFLGNIKPNQLAGEGDGRVNVLLIGVGGAQHPGGNLADTIMVASFDPKNKDVALLSIPRDLYVQYDGKHYSKINSVHSYGEQNAKTTGGGPALLKKTVSDLLDLPIHYYVRVDFAALEKIVDTLGGVTVNVEKPIVDLSYPADNMIDYAPFRLAAGTQTLNGVTALKYARSRHASGSEGSDFARAKRQQKVIAAIKDKALTAGVLTNPKKIADLITILGNHIKTDISLVDMERFVQFAKDVDTSKIVNKVLDNGPGGPLISQSGDERGYILLPRTGDYSEIQQIAHEIFTDPYLKEENASISLINASGSVSTGTQALAMLKSYGYNVTDNTPRGQVKQTKTQIFDATGKKPYTKQFLEGRFKVSATRGTLPSPSVSPTTKTTASSKASVSPKVNYDITLVVGSDYRPIRVNLNQSTAKATPTPKATIAPSPSSQASSSEEADAAEEN